MKIPPFAWDDYFAHHPIPPEWLSPLGAFLAKQNKMMTQDERARMAEKYRMARRTGGANASWRLRAMRAQLRGTIEFLTNEAP